MKISAGYYQQFDADPALDVPGEGYGGWRRAEIEIDPRRTALVVMHAWDFGGPDQFPGWRRAVEYIPRAEAITKGILPRLLSAVRASPVSVMHVASSPRYCPDFPGYQRAVGLAGESHPPPEQAEADESLGRLRDFRSKHVFVGQHNEADVQEGLAGLRFPDEARPRGDEGVAVSAAQLHALCREAGVNQLIYTGFAINWCLLLSPGGMAEMGARGYLCSAIRQAVTAVENRETARLESAKELALWRVALAYGFVFNLEDLLGSLKTLREPGTSGLL